MKNNEKNFAIEIQFRNSISIVLFNLFDEKIFDPKNFDDCISMELNCHILFIAFFKRVRVYSQ